MKTLFNIVAISCFTLLFISCSKDEDKKGCTDITATNFDNLAIEDDGTCEYADTAFTIWENGKLGFWGDNVTGSFTISSCYTDTKTIFLNPDSTFVPADTTIIPGDTNVVPIILPDTIITPPDTIITGDTYLLLNSDAAGSSQLIVRLLNKKNASEFKNGYLIFSAKKHPDAMLSTFDIMIHGNQFSTGGSNCGNFLRSDAVGLSTNTLDTNSFKEITIPLTDFSNRYMQDIDLVFGLKSLNNAPNTNQIMVRSIKWVSRLDD
jgi:hypothetical protein